MTEKTAKRSFKRFDTLEVGPATFEIFDYQDGPPGLIAFVIRPRGRRRFRTAFAMDCPLIHCSIETLSSLRVSVEETMAGLLERYEPLRQATQIRLIGDSAGGYGASMLGVALAEQLPAAQIQAVAFNPPTRIWPPNPAQKQRLYKALMARAERDPALMARLEAEGDLEPRLRRLAEAGADNFRGRIITSARQRLDSSHAERLRGAPFVEVEMFDSADHGAFTWWMDLPPMEPDALRDHVRDRWTAQLDAKAARAAEADGDETQMPVAELKPERLDREVEAITAFKTRYPDFSTLFRAI